ncbi:hypothetical protein ACIQU4_25845 [Streptomyces sp. NPDC090741]|uniref:hypothetical protein n=1 Tax=Streptomyces sp. NPDC090741 TaxID=3365967 RepID=UPI0038049366
MGEYVDHVLARGGELLGERAAQAAGAFDGETAFGPLLAPAHELAERARVNDESALGHLMTERVNGDGSPELRAAYGVGPDTAAQLLTVVAGDVEADAELQAGPGGEPWVP